MAVKRKRTETVHFRTTLEIKAMLKAIEERDGKTATKIIEDLITKEAEGLPLNIQLNLV